MNFLPKPVLAENLLEMIRIHLDLVWIYEEIEDVEASKPQEISGVQSSTPNTSSPALPPTDVLKLIADLAKKGDLDEILEVAQQLEESGQKFSWFTQEVSHLAESFQVKKLQDFIKEYVA